MAEYRLYQLDGVDRVCAGEWIEAENDAAAIEAVRALCKSVDCELWQGDRFITRIGTRRPSPAHQ